MSTSSSTAGANTAQFIKGVHGVRYQISDVARAFRYIWLEAGGGDPRLRLASDPDRLLVIRPGGAR